MNWTNHLFHYLSAKKYFFYIFPQAKYFFHFLRKKSRPMSKKLDPELDLEVEETIEARLHKLKRHVMMMSEARQFF